MKQSELEGSRILLVEDEESLAIGLEYNLSAEGCAIDLAEDGKKALAFIEKNVYDLLILDIMLPYVDGFEIAKRVRAKNMRVPILFLTARTDAKDRIKGLRIGADDYLTKPFHLDELLLRVRGMLRRKSWYKESIQENTVFCFGENEINFENYQCRAGEKQIQLTAHEAVLLNYLITHKNKIVSRKELLQNVWNTHSDIETRTVDNFIVRLRRYFETDPNSPRYIKSIRGKGYIFNDNETNEKI